MERGLEMHRNTGGFGTMRQAQNREEWEDRGLAEVSAEEECKGGGQRWKVIPKKAGEVGRSGPGPGDLVYPANS